MKIEIGHGGFMTVTPDNSDGNTRLEFGVGVIRMVVKGDAIRRVNMGKPQNDYSVSDLLELLRELDGCRRARLDYLDQMAEDRQRKAPCYW